MSFSVCLTAGLLHLWTAHHIQVLKGNFVHNKTGCCLWSNLTVLWMSPRMIPLFRRVSTSFFSPFFFPGVRSVFSSWKYKSKDPEQDGSSQEWIEAFSTTDRAKEREQPQQQMEERCWELDNMDLSAGMMPLLLCAENVISKTAFKNLAGKQPFGLHELDCRLFRNIHNPFSFQDTYIFQSRTGFTWILCSTQVEQRKLNKLIPFNYFMPFSKLLQIY